MPELMDDQDWIDRRAIVNAHNSKGEWLSYYYHLSTNEWTPPFDSEMKVQAYAVDFDRIYEEFLGPIHAFFCSVYQSTVRDIQQCAD